MSEYTAQAEQFLADTTTDFSIVYLYTGPYFDDDKEERDVYQFTIKNARGVYSAKFGDSIHNTKRRAFIKTFALGMARQVSRWEERAMRAVDVPLVKSGPFFRLQKGTKAEKPTAYDVLAGLTKYDPGTFADFCSDYGYDVDSRKAEKIYLAVQEEHVALRRMFTAEQMEQLQEIV